MPVLTSFNLKKLLISKAISKAICIQKEEMYTFFSIVITTLTLGKAAACQSQVGLVDSG